MISILGWTLTTWPDPHTLTFPLLILIHIIMGIATAGTSLSASSIGLKLAPKGEGVAYLSAMSFTNAIASGIAPILGGAISAILLDQNFSVILNWENSNFETNIMAISINSWDFFFVISFLIGCIAYNRLYKIEEHGSIRNRELLSEIRTDIQREMRTVGSGTSLRSIVRFPVALFNKK
jgi:MFS family permease